MVRILVVHRARHNCTSYRKFGMDCDANYWPLDYWKRNISRSNASSIESIKILQLNY